jgi:hypothetical protein
MSTRTKKSYGAMLVLVMLGLAALYLGSSSLTLVVPAAVVVAVMGRFGGEPQARSGRS